MSPRESVAEVVSQMTDGWGADIVFECSGAERALAGIFEPLRPGGCVGAGGDARRPDRL